MVHDRWHQASARPVIGEKTARLGEQDKRPCRPGAGQQPDNLVIGDTGTGIRR
jgi:hypothetical protein